MFLAANIAIDKNTYKQQFLDEGILLVIQNFLFTIIEKYDKQTLLCSHLANHFIFFISLILSIKKYQEEISL